MKKFLNLFATLLVTVLLCTGCEKKNIVDSIAEMYDDGIETVDKAKSVDDVQQYYNDINKKVEDFKQSHLREMAALDSTITKIEEAKMIFTKACCIKASSFEGFIKDTEGVVIGVNDKGEVLPLECIEGDDGFNENTSNNPLGLTGITPIFKKSGDTWDCMGITVQDSEGDYIYNDEDAEQYYEQYLPLFFIAHKIVPDWSRNDSLVNYLTNHLSDIVSNLPLDDSYPKDIREYVNKKYYDNKDAMSTLCISKREYGSIWCEYYDNPNRRGSCFRVKRDKNNNGRLTIATLFNL
jgi:hypothetical protein